MFPIETSSSLVTLGGHELVLGIDRDISERRRTEAELRHLNDRLAHDAQHDALTGLPNRVMLMDRLSHEQRRVERNGAQLAVMFVDLDDFKCVNDSLGHAAGDAVLREVAERLQRALRPHDTVARVGGDEFVVVVADLQGAQHAARVARRVQEAVMTPICCGGRGSHGGMQCRDQPVAARWHTGRRPAAVRGPGHVRDQERGQECRALLRAGHGRSRTGTDTSGNHTDTPVANLTCLAPLPKWVGA